MPTTPPSPGRFVAMFLAIGATALFAASSQLDSFLRGLCFGAGLVLLVLAVVTVRRMRPGAATGWRPSSQTGQQADAREPR